MGNEDEDDQWSRGEGQELDGSALLGAMSGEEEEKNNVEVSSLKLAYMNV